MASDNRTVCAAQLHWYSERCQGFVPAADADSPGTGYCLYQLNYPVTQACFLAALPSSLGCLLFSSEIAIMRLVDTKQSSTSFPALALLPFSTEGSLPGGVSSGFAARDCTRSGFAYILQRESL